MTLLKNITYFGQGLYIQIVVQTLLFRTFKLSDLLYQLFRNIGKHKLLYRLATLNLPAKDIADESINLYLV